MNVYPIRAVRDGQWKYIRNLHPEFTFCRLKSGTAFDFRRSFILSPPQRSATSSV